MNLGGVWRTEPWAGGKMGAHLFNKSYLTLLGVGCVCVCVCMYVCRGGQLLIKPLSVQKGKLNIQKTKIVVSGPMLLLLLLSHFSCV